MTNKEAHGKPELDIKIIVAHHIGQESEIIDCPPYIPVLCGAAFDTTDKNVPMARDDTGDNISEKYRSYGELTALYWAWKNLDADYFGLCHDYRYFSFEGKWETDCYSNVVRDYLCNENLLAFKIENIDRITDIVKSYDILLTESLDVSVIPEKYESLFAQFDMVPTLHREDLDEAVKLAEEMYPEYSGEVTEYFCGTRYPPCQMFIMKKELFRDYCEWLFPLLSELEKRLVRTHYCREELMGISHIAERLLGVYVRHRRRQNRCLRITELQAAAFYRPRPVRPPHPSKAANNIPVVFASSDYFVPYLAVTIYSMLVNASKKYHYDLIILTSDMGEAMEKNLRSMLEQNFDCTLRIMDVSTYVRDKQFVVNGGHVSKETFYRLLVPDLFCNFDRIIYLDSDLIVQEDISQLYFQPMRDTLVAATLDCDFIGEYNGGIEEVKKYCDESLDLKDPYAYFQAGVLIFNIRNMRDLFTEGELIEFAQTKSFMYVDQDVLNVKCAGKVTYLPQKWNVMTDCAGARITYLIARSPEKNYAEYLGTRKAPAIIHYAGFEKPWNNPLSDFANVFWSYAEKTPFYEVILFRMNDEALTRSKEAVDELKAGLEALQTHLEKHQIDLDFSSDSTINGSDEAFSRKLSEANNRTEKGMEAWPKNKRKYFFRRKK